MNLRDHNGQSNLTEGQTKEIIAINLLRSGLLSDEQIAAMTEISLSKIKQLKSTIEAVD